MATADRRAPADAPIVLVGSMGAGKTTVGRRLAVRLGRSYVDNDEVLATAAGMPTTAYAAGNGAAALHALEEQVLATTLAAAAPLVVAAPGSVALSPRAGFLLEGCTVVWLRARPDTVLARVGVDPARPLLDGATEATVRALLAEREPGWARLATTVVDVDGRAVDDIVDRIVHTLGHAPAACTAP